MSTLLDFHIDRKLDQDERLYFKVPATEGRTELLDLEAELEWHGSRWYIIDRTEVRLGTETYFQIEAAPTWEKLAHIKIPGTVSLVATTASDGVSAILDYAANFLPLWTQGTTSTTASAVYDTDWTDASVLTMLRDWAIVTGTYLEFDTYSSTVDVRASRGVNRGTPFRYRRNLTSIERRVRPPQATAIFAYGRDDLTVAGVNGGRQGVEDLSYYTAQGLTEEEARARHSKRMIVSDSAFTDETALYNHAVSLLAAYSQPQIEYKATVVDLSEIIAPAADLAALRVGDTCGVYDEELGISVETVLVRHDYYPNEPIRNRVELGQLPNRVLSSSAARGREAGPEWELFRDSNTEQRLRNDATYLINRIPLKFREGGAAVFGLQVDFVGVGTGTLSVSAMDAESDTLVGPKAVHEIPYTDAEEVHWQQVWSANEIPGGQYDYRIRVQAVNTGSPSASAGVNIAASGSDFHILAQLAVRETPVAENTATFDWNGILTSRSDGTVQEWVVPDGVTTCTVSCTGGSGGVTGADERMIGGGGVVTATFDCIPGNTWYVYVGSNPQAYLGGPNAGWPNGGLSGDAGSGADAGGGGGGSSHIMMTEGDFSSVIIVAPGGGGCSSQAGSRNTWPQVEAGGGGFYQGGHGHGGWGYSYDDPIADPRYAEPIGSSFVYGYGAGGGGATQTAGGLHGYSSPGGEGEDGSFGQGGKGFDTTNSFAFGCGGGGGGYYGGGGAPNPVIIGGGYYGGDGGGGSGYVSPAAWDISTQDNVRKGVAANGQVVISWDSPD